MPISLFISLGAILLLAHAEHPAASIPGIFLPANSECIRGGPYDYPRCSPGYWCEGVRPSRCVRRLRAGATCDNSECAERQDI